MIVSLTKQFQSKLLFIKYLQILFYSSLGYIWKMERQINLIDFKIAINILSDYISEKDAELIRIQQNFNNSFLQQKEANYYQWLIKTGKEIVSNIQLTYEGTKSIFHDIKMDFTYTFFYKCLATLEQTIRYLIQALNQRINQVIDCKAQSVVQHTVYTSIIGVTEELCNNQLIQKAKRAINKDLESIDYYLNLLAYQDSKMYEEYKFQCEKLLLQRQNIQKIKASDATKQIYQTANMIQNTLQNTQKLFQQSYYLKYLEFNSFLSSIQDPEEMINMLKSDIQVNSKEKILQQMVKTVNKYINKTKNNQRKQKMQISTQTDEAKNRIQDKWQALIMAQKRNNEKLAQEIEKLKKNSGSSSAIEKFSDIQKKFQKQEALRKQIQSKYTILQGLYNEKCYDLMKSSNQSKRFFKTELLENKKISNFTQTQYQYGKAKSLIENQCQTDSDFYYYYLQKNKIKDMQQKIEEQQKIINHKQEIIKDMQAVKALRKKFKSKQDICSVVLIPKNESPIAKSLRYLHEEESDAEINDRKETGKISSIGGDSSVKKEVTFQKFEDQQDTQKSIVQTKKDWRQFQKAIKKTDGTRYRPYLTFNAKIVNSESQRQFITANSKLEQPHQISIRPILKIGSTVIKCERSVQTDLSNKDTLNQLEKTKLWQQKVNQTQKAHKKTNEAQKNDSKDFPKQSQIGFSQRYSINIRKQKTPPKYNFVKRNQSNFVEDKKPQPKIDAQNCLPNLHIKSQTVSAINRKREFSKARNLLKATKPSDRIQTQANEVLHVNNLLCFNFSSFLPINCTTTQVSMNQGQKFGRKGQITRGRKTKR